MIFFASSDDDESDCVTVEDGFHAVVDAVLDESHATLSCPSLAGEPPPRVVVFAYEGLYESATLCALTDVAHTQSFTAVLGLRGVTDGRVRTVTRRVVGFNRSTRPASYDVTVSWGAILNWDCLLPGGRTVVVCANAVEAAAVEAEARAHAADWNVDALRRVELPRAVAVVVNRRAARHNAAATSSDRDRGLHYAPGRRPEQRGDSPTAGFRVAACADERAALERIAVALSSAERSASRLSPRAHARAVRALTEDGVCVIRGLFDPDLVRGWGSAALADLDAARARLAEQYGIALEDVGNGAVAMPFNFAELAMREAKRFDLRRSPQLLALASALEARERAGVAPAVAGDVSRAHPSIVAVVTAAMNPRNPGIDHTEGNWGAWNFGGEGPGAPPPTPDVSEVGTVLSMPGCEDQAVHADTPHLFEHLELPPHYVNLFLPAVAGNGSDASVGQTAWVVGTHRLECAARLMGSAAREHHRCTEFLQRLVRPHLDAGDAVLFDTRTLHFGLANRSGASGGRVAAVRPVLYVNYTQPWWNRPKVDKNFEKRQLFDMPGAAAATIRSSRS